MSKYVCSDCNKKLKQRKTKDGCSTVRGCKCGGLPKLDKPAVVRALEDTWEGVIFEPNAATFAKCDKDDKINTTSFVKYGDILGAKGGSGGPTVPKGATKNDNGKPDLSLVPRAAIEAIGRAMTFGAFKYSRNNWKKGMEWSRLVASCMRHLTAWNDGENQDPESTLNHLDHALACLAMLADYQKTKNGIDNRFS
jgi:hypothetical protein